MQIPPFSIHPEGLEPLAPGFLPKKNQEFHLAMERYHQKRIYQWMALMTSCVVVLLQFLSLLQCVYGWQSMGCLALIITFLVAYIVADFVSGVAHMIMDNNDHYAGFWGPLVAAFHLHHLKPTYTKKRSIQVYFLESGTKFWLVPYLLLLVGIQYQWGFLFIIQFFLVCFGILSSIAELSHYWCHQNKYKHPILIFLQKNRMLLAKKHHGLHHQFDNRNYAFLNGITNPLLNRIAARFYLGYKNHTDVHAKAYMGKQSQNRC